MRAPKRLKRPPRVRAIPAVEKVLQAVRGDAAALELPRPLVVAAVRRVLAGLRAGAGGASFDDAVATTRIALRSLAASRLRPVINGTGVVVHTNLGRAPLPAQAIRALGTLNAGYCNLELDLATGGRGARAPYLEGALAILCGADAAIVVNNCAAALVLALRHFVAARPGATEVVISRGELIQIGGGFRIPEILEASGAVLREVGTTNRTELRDYAGALSKKTALVLKVHRSNFFMEGFVDGPTTRELAALARKRRVPFVSDLGSGAIVDTPALLGGDAQDGGGPREPTVEEELRAGADLVLFSGDKLFGGPQAGVVVGKRRLVERLGRDPFFRALRASKAWP